MKMREATKQLVESCPLLYHNHCLYICDFVVDEALRGKGIGQAFLKKIQIWAKDQGYEELELSSSFFRTQAHEFYIQKYVTINKM